MLNLIEAVLKLKDKGVHISAYHQFCSSHEVKSFLIFTVYIHMSNLSWCQLKWSNHVKQSVVNVECCLLSKFDDDTDDDDEYKDTFDDNTNEGRDTVWDNVPRVL